MKTKFTESHFISWKSFLLFSIHLIFYSYSSMAQVQVGADIDGEAPNDYSGYSLSMPDVNTVAIGAIRNGVNSVNSGHVRIYRWDVNGWVQKGSDIDGESAGDFSGRSVSMPDSNTVAIGANENAGNGGNSGHVRVYSWDGSSWIQKGTDIDGEAAYDESGMSVSMPDSNTIAIGARYNAGNGSNSGHVRVYSWDGSSWIQKGTDIDGEAAYDESGMSVSMPDNNTIAIGAPRNGGNGTASGHVRVYHWNGNGWVQKGGDIDGEAFRDESAWSVSMPDSNTLAIGAHKNDGNGTDAGHVRVYSWVGNAWIQKGIDIDGEAAGDQSGQSVSMPNSNTVAVGSSGNDGNGSVSGHVRIYSWNGISWQQRGVDIDGEAAGDQSGHAVSMPDSNTIAIGAPFNDGNGTDAGHVRVYSLCSGSVDTSVTLSVNTLVSNDTTATYQWVNCDSAYASVSGETNRSFTPPNTGNYSVIVSRSHCEDTSACYNVVVTGLNEQKAKEEQFTVYPNPTKGIFTIKSNVENKNATFEIRDITGKIIQKGNLKAKQTTQDLSKNSSGIYILKVADQNIKIILK